jgi:hypothetical protein
MSNLVWKEITPIPLDKEKELSTSFRINDLLFEAWIDVYPGEQTLMMQSETIFFIQKFLSVAEAKAFAETFYAQQSSLIGKLANK